MSETFSNSNPSTYSTPVAPAGTGATPTTTVVTQPSQEPKTVNMTVPGNSETTAQATPVVGGNFDTNRLPSISHNYFKANEDFFNNNPQLAYKTYGDDDIEYSFNNTINNPELLKGGTYEDGKRLGIKPKGRFGFGFIGQIKGDSEWQREYRESQNLFETLDNTNYTYGRLFFQGNWINTRTPIDENGNPTGLPEMLPA